MHAILAFCLATIPHQTLCIVDPCLKRRKEEEKEKKNNPGIDIRGVLSTLQRSRAGEHECDGFTLLLTHCVHPSPPKPLITAVCLPPVTSNAAAPPRRSASY